MALSRLLYIVRAAFCLHRSLGILLLIGLAVCPVYAAAPTVSSFITPSDNATGVSESPSLILQFDQNVVKGSSGNITIKKYSDDSTIETIAVTSGSVSAAGSAFVTITLSTLGFGTRYYVFIDANALKNGSAEGFAGISSKDTWDFTTKDNDGTLTASGTISEPIALPSTATTTGAAVDIFDFTLTDGGASDGLALAVTQVVLNTSGTGPFAKVTFRLNGPDAADVSGTYSSGANTLTFSGLTISVANAANETYTVNAYYSDNTNLSENQTLILSIDGDTDLTVSGTGTQISGANAAISNSTGSTLNITATTVAFTTAPAGSVSGSALTTQPIVTAQDAAGNTDVDFTETVTLTEGSAGTLSNSTQTATAGVATFTSLAYTATADGESFTLTANDQDGVGSDLSTANAGALNADVVANKLVFTTQPAGSVSGSALTTQPVVVAQDANNITDTGFTETVTLTEGSAGTLSNSTQTATAGVATFTSLAYTATADGESFTLTANDQDGVGSDLSTANAGALNADVVANKLVFTTQPAPLSPTSGASYDFTTDPVVEAQDANGVKDTGFTDTVTLSETGVGTATYTNNAVAAVAGIATFTGLTTNYTATADGETFGLQADDTAGGAEGNITNLPTSSSLTADVVATKLVFTTQPAPLSLTSGSQLDFTTDPVIEAQDANGVKDSGFTDTVTLSETGAGTATYTNNAVAAVAGIATFTGLTTNYTATANAEAVGLQADDTAGGAEGDITTLPTSSAITAYTLNTDGTLSAAGTVSEPTALPSTATTTGAAVAIFDFTLADGGSSDGLSLAVTQIVLNTSGTGPFAKVAFRLNGPDATNVSGTYNSGANTLTFSGLAISVANAANETYTVNAYYSDNTNLSENQTLILSIDGDTDLTVSGTGTQMSGANAAVNNSTGSTLSITATQLVLHTAPADTRQVDTNDEVLSGSAFQTQPIVRAHDAAGNLDVDFSDAVSAGKQSGSGQIGGTTSATANAGIATFADLRYDAATDGGIFTLSFDDQTSGSEGDLTAISSSSLSADVVASQWVFSRQPADVLSGLAVGTQPELQARDAQGTTDLDFTQTTTLALNTADSIENSSATANAGTASFSNLKITGIGQGRTLSASGGSLTSAISTSFDVGQAQATIHFTSNTHVVFDGQKKTLISTSDPANLTTVTTYNGSTDILSDPGTYQVVATINDAIYAGTATGTLIIQPPPTPTAGLQASPLEGGVPLTVTFTNTSQGFGYTFLEIFDSENQTFDDPETVQVTYDIPGTYEALLTIRGQGGTNQTRTTIVVHGPPALNQVIASPDESPVGETQTLDLSGLDPATGAWSVELLGSGPIIRTEINDERVSFFSDSDRHGAQAVNIIRTNPWGLSTSQQFVLTWAPAPEPAEPSTILPTSLPTSPPTSLPTILPTNDENDTTPPTNDNGDTTPPTNDENNTTPPANDENNTTPPANDENNTTPPASDENNTTPPASDNGDTPPDADGATASPSNDETAPDSIAEPVSPQEMVFFDAFGQPIHGLFDDDMKVGFEDYFLFAEHYGSTPEQSDYDARFDLDGNGQVGLSDFFLFADSFGKEAVVP